MPRFRKTPAPRPDAAPKKKVARPRRPSDLGPALTALDALRPAHVPPGATLVAAWVELPGENTQRSMHFTVAEGAFKGPIKKDFSATLAEQVHPGVIAAPGVHIQMHVLKPGDDINARARAKYVIDRLQIRREVVLKNGKTRVHGLLDLIPDDKLLNAQNTTVEEIRATRSEAHNDCKVLVWVWDAAALAAEIAAETEAAELVW